MIFLDTCIWIELCGARTPVSEQERRQARAASNLLTECIRSHQKIITCKEQLLEIINAIQKAKMREYNRECRNRTEKGVGNVKEFRMTEAFSNVEPFCRQVYDDVMHLAMCHELKDYSVEDIISNIRYVDINDYIYYDYCIKNGHDFYTFDQDFLKLGENSKIHII